MAGFQPESSPATLCQAYAIWIVGGGWKPQMWQPGLERVRERRPR